MVKGELDPELLLLLFSNLTLLLSFMVSDEPGDHTVKGNGPEEEVKRLLSNTVDHFVEEVVEAVIENDVDLATSIPERDLARLARGATVGRQEDPCKLVPVAGRLRGGACFSLCSWLFS